MLCEIVYANQKLGLVHMIKVDVGNGFYSIGFRPSDATKLGLVFPSEAGYKDLVAIPLTLPMVWKNLPPILCTPTETVADLDNEPYAHTRQRCLTSCMNVLRLFGLSQLQA